MKFYKILIPISLALGLFSNASAQQNIYVPQGASLYTHAGVEIAFFGNIINDAQGGLNHNNGGKMYLYRDSTTGLGSIQIIDGPNSPTPTDNYNSNGSYIRVFDLVTDNTTGAAVPSGTQINMNSGSGQIEVKQELKITNSHQFNNGIIWTPRAEWRHAFVHYESTANYSGVAPNNTTGNHVDGYAACSGKSSFMFPIGNGVTPRMAGISNANNGEFKSAYFAKNALNGTLGISGTSANAQKAPEIISIGQSEFWDIDGNSETNVVITSSNNSPNTSNWNNEFAGLSTSTEMVIIGWDDWENIGQDLQPNSLTQDGIFTSTKSINPDLGGTSGNPYGAFTWGLIDKNSLGISDINLSVLEVDCHAMISFRTKNEINTSHANIMRKESNSDFQKIAEVSLSGNTTGSTSYQYDDHNIAVNNKYIYRVDIVDNDGSKTLSDNKILELSCSEEVTWKIFPNPSHGHIMIESNYDEDIQAIKVYNAIGKLVNIVRLDPSRSAGYFIQDLDFSALARGEYHLSITGRNGQEVKTFKISIVD